MHRGPCPSNPCPGNQRCAQLIKPARWFSQISSAFTDSNSERSFKWVDSNHEMEIADCDQDYQDNQQSCFATWATTSDQPKYECGDLPYW